MTDNVAQLTDLLREMDFSEIVGSEDIGIFAMLFEGPQMEAITLALDDTNQVLDEEDLHSLAMAEGGVILYQDEDGEWGVEFFEEEEDLEDRWAEWENEARAAYGEAMGLGEHDDF